MTFPQPSVGVTVRREVSQAGWRGARSRRGIGGRRRRRSWIRSSGCCAACLRSARRSRRHGRPSCCATNTGYDGSVDLVKRLLRELRPVSVRPAQRTGYRPGHVLQLDWAEMPTRPRLAGRERRVYALVASLPYSGAQTTSFSLDLTLESFHEDSDAPGDVRAGVAGRGAARRRLRQPALGCRPPRRRRGRLESPLPAPARPLRLPRLAVHARVAAREGFQHGVEKALSLSKWSCTSEKRTARRAGPRGVAPHRLESQSLRGGR